jgi:hypothetical protein
MRILLEDVRLAFPVLWEPEEFKEGDGKPRYSAAFLIAHGSEMDTRIRQAIWEEACAVFGEARAQAMLQSMQNSPQQMCYMSGDLKEYDGYPGNMVLSSHRKATDGAPTVVDADRAPLGPKSGRPYGGCYVDAFVDIYAQKGLNPGIRAGLAGVQYRREGTAFSNATAAKAADFNNLSTGANGAVDWGAPAGGPAPAAPQQAWPQQAAPAAPQQAPSSAPWGGPPSQGMV